MSPVRITWYALGTHALIGAAVALVAACLLGPVWAWPAAGIMAAIYTFREAWTAADRHDTTLADGWNIVLSGEPGWSPWNLRLQAIAPGVGGAIVALLAGIIA